MLSQHLEKRNEESYFLELSHKHYTDVTNDLNRLSEYNQRPFIGQKY